MNIIEIVNLSYDEYLDVLIPKRGQQVDVDCVDGTATTTYGHLAFAWAYFRINSKYDVPVSVKQIPRPTTVPSNKEHMRLANLALNVVYEGLERKVPLNVISETGLEILEIQINSCMRKLERFSMTVDAEDYYDIANDDVIAGIRTRMTEGVAKASTSSAKFGFLQTAYQEFDNIIRDEGMTRFKHNGLVNLILSGTCKVTQVKQGVIARGFCSDVNSDFFSDPVMSSFADGMNTPYEYALETCSGSKAAMYQKDPMSDTEYLHRLVQMIAATFQNLHVGDCGSKSTYPCRVTDSNHRLIIGKYYVESGVVKEVTTANSKSLVGRVLATRNVAGCSVMDAVGCCSVCAGAQSLSFAGGANLGHTATTRFMGTGSQKVLSVKHDDLSSLSLAMEVNEPFARHLSVAINNREVKLRNNNVTLIIPQAAMPNIRYVSFVDDVDTLQLTEMSSINSIEVELNGDEEFGEQYAGPVGTKGEVVNLSKEMLAYLAEDMNRLELKTYNRKRQYFINMDMFPEDTAVFITPFKHFDMLDQHKLTKRFLYSPKKDDDKDGHIAGPKLTDFNTFGEAAMALLSITQEKLGISLAVLEMAIYPFTVTNTNSQDMRPVRGSNTCEFMGIEALYNDRSLAAKLVSERQLEVMTSPLIITNSRRANHPFDHFYMDV